MAKGFKNVEVSSADEALQPLTPANERSFGRLGYVGAYVVNAPDDESKRIAEEALADDYLLVPNIELSMPVVPITTEKGASSTLRKHITWPEPSGVGAARDLGCTGYGTLVGVLDTGCNANHDQFSEHDIDFIFVDPGDTQRTRESDTRAIDLDVTDGHGTHICGTIAGKQVGISPSVKLLVASVVMSGTYKTNLERVVFGLNWLTRKFSESDNEDKPAVINMSFGFLPDYVDIEGQGHVIAAIQRVVGRMYRVFGILPIAAIGNDGPGKVRAPGYFEDVLSVGAVGNDLQAMPWSGGREVPLPAQPDVVGFGENVYSSFRQSKNGNSLYIEKSGTSMAAAYVTGIAALSASCHNLQGTALRSYLVDNALPLNQSSQRTGHGLVRFK
jgi:subtilisin family serine protease